MLAVSVAAIAFAASSAAMGSEINLTLAHALNETHSAHVAMKEMADLINKNSDGRIEVQIFPNGQMGTAAETLEMCMTGDLSMVHVGAPQLGTYDDAYHVFGLPYLFKDKDEYYKVMQSKAMQDFFYSTADKGFVTLNFLSSGDRNFYTPKKAIKAPADLKGMKIRVQDMKTQIGLGIRKRKLVFIELGLILLKLRLCYIQISLGGFILLTRGGIAANERFLSFHFAFKLTYFGLLGTYGRLGNFKLGLGTF